MQPRTDTTQPIVTKELLTELTTLFLSLSWVLEYEAEYITQKEGNRHKIYFQPLTTRVLFKPGTDYGTARSCNVSLATHVLQYLTSQLAKDGDLNHPKHLFLKTLSGQLQRILRDPTFGDDTPLMVEFLGFLKKGKPALFREKFTPDPEKSCPYWAVKPMFAHRATGYKTIADRNRWTKNIGRAIYIGDQDLRRQNFNLGLSLVNIVTPRF